MFLRLFKGAGPGVLFMVAAVIACVWITAFINPLQAALTDQGKDPMPLYEILMMVVGKDPLIGTIASFVMFCIMAFILVNFNTSTVFISERSFFPALFYALIMGLFPEFRTVNPSLPASFFLIAAIIRISASYHKPDVAYNFFDAGLLIGTGSLFQANLIWFGVIIFIGLALFRPGNFLEIVVSVIGLATPFFLLFGIYYVTGRDLIELLIQLRENLLGAAGEVLTTERIVALAMVYLPVLLSIAHLILNLNTKKIKARATLSLLIWVLIAGVAVFFAVPSSNAGIVWFVSIPASYMLTHYFLFIRVKLMPEILFLMIFLAAAWMQVLYLVQ